MSGLRFESSDDMHNRIVALADGDKPQSKFDELVLKEMKDVAAQGGHVVFAGDLPDPVDDYERHVSDEDD